jgi:hypothetical protein
MNKASSHQNLAFIACQPRSGSTMLQRILGAHSEIHTISEPWLMLHPLYALREEGIQTEYSAGLAREALNSVFEELPRGRKDYIEGVADMYQTLYAKLLEPTDATLFVDKTPRYYLILPELKEVFPEANYILLVRHPLSVLASILRTWVRSDWLSLFNFRTDLLKAPQQICAEQDGFESSASFIRYEDLVRHPESEISELCKSLNLNFEPGMIEYGDGQAENWEFGDPESVYEHNRPKISRLEKWAQPDNAQEWRLLWEYAHQIGPGIFKAFGYSFEHCLQKLEGVQPTSRDLRYTVSLELLLENRSGLRKKLARHVISMTDAMREGGAQAAAVYALKRLKSQVPGIT